MNKRRRNIAIILGWIFIFPIVFQSLHIITALSQTHEHFYKIGNDHSLAQLVQDNLTIDSQSVNPCHICAYHFSINDIPYTSFLRSVLLPVQDFVQEMVKHLPFRLFGSNKSPRAPPVF